MEGCDRQAELIAFDLLGGSTAQIYFDILIFPTFKACIFCQMAKDHVGPL